MDDFLAQAKRGDLSVGRYEKISYFMKTFLGFFGRETDSNTITEAALLEYRKEITGRLNSGKGGQLSDYSARYLLQFAGRFIRWLWRSRYLQEQPRNIETFATVKVQKRSIKVFTVEQVKALWKACTNDRQRLFIALAINTGVNQADMAKLTPSHLEPPHLVLHRGKTGVKGCWKMWDVTRRLIDSCKRTGAKNPTDLLFLTRKGMPLVETGFRKNGGTFRNDSVRQVFDDLLDKVGIDGTFVMLRKTPANILKAKGYGDVIQFFLSHENDALFLTNGIVTKEHDENSVAETFYVSQGAKLQALKTHPRLLEAIDLLEREFGLAMPLTKG